MKYEYKQVKKWETMSDDEFLAELNELGAEGWELVNLCISDDFTAEAFLMKVTFNNKIT